jgi:branched-subunit amino acid ABC-type transport system permease component
MVYLVIAFLGLTLVTTLTKVGVLLKTDYEIEEISIIITFALMMLIQGVVSELFGATPKTLSLPITGLSFSVGEKLSITVTEILIVLISLITFFISYTGLFSSHMPIGREVVCYIQDKELSRIVGLNLDKLNVLVGTTSIGIVGVAGALYSLLYPLHPYIGVYYTVISFVAMAVSGVGKLSTSYIIALAIVIAQSLIGSVITYSAATGVVYILLVMLLIIRPRGIVRGLR